MPFGSKCAPKSHTVSSRGWVPSCFGAFVVPFGPLVGARFLAGGQLEHLGHSQPCGLAVFELFGCLFGHFGQLGRVRIHALSRLLMTYGLLCSVESCAGLLKQISKLS